MAQTPLDPKDLIPDLCQGRSALWVILFSEALVIVLTLLSSGALDFSWEQFGLLSLYVQWMVLICAAGLCRLRQYLPLLNINVLMAISFSMVLLVNLLLSMSTQWAMNYVFLENYGWDWILRNQLITAILCALVLHYFYVQMQGKLRARSELQSRVQALHSRIRPHFLFNSMNIIASLIHVDPDKAEQAVEDLSELFRASLKEAGSEVTLKQEMDLCFKYTNIEQLRLGERLTMDWQITAPDSTPIPLLTLQPLIENAIYHGIAPCPNGGCITVSVEAQEQHVHIQVTNPLPSSVALSARKESGNQMALENIQHRLHALYGENVTMNVEQTDETYIMNIQYPLNQNNKTA
jgi:two-component system sensor histidine kinase AlgZ